MRSPCSSLLFAIALLTASPRPAHAEQRSAEYEQAFKQGTSLFEQGDYAAARGHFERALELHPEPLLLLNIGSTYRREGELDAALGYYRRFLAEAAADDEYRPAVQQIIAELEEEIAERDRAAAAAATPPTAATPPLVAPTPRRDRGRRLRLTGLATAAAGIVLVGVGVQQGVHAGNIEEELANASGPWTAERQARYDEGQSAETRALVLGITGGIAVAAGTTLYLLGRGDEHDDRALAIVPYTDGAASGLALTGAF